MPIQRHSVVIPKDDGGVEVYPLKEWLRQNPDQIPAGLDATGSTSHQLRLGLRRMGWTMEESPTEVRLIRPGTATGAGIVGEILGPVDQTDEASDAAFFTLATSLEILSPRISIRYR
jgi:hypothetical protein